VGGLSNYCVRLSLYVTYCFCSNNTVTKVRFTGKIKVIYLWGYVDPFSFFLNDAPGWLVIRRCVMITMTKTTTKTTTTTTTTTTATIIHTAYLYYRTTTMTTTTTTNSITTTMMLQEKGARRRQQKQRQRQQQQRRRQRPRRRSFSFICWKFCWTCRIVVVCWEFVSQALVCTDPPCSLNDIIICINGWSSVAGCVMQANRMGSPFLCWWSTRSVDSWWKMTLCPSSAATKSITYSIFSTNPSNFPRVCLH